MYVLLYRREDGIEFMKNLIIGKSKSSHRKFCKNKRITRTIAITLGLQLMNITIHLDGEAVLRTVEVEDESCTQELTPKAYYKCIIAEMLPEDILSFRWVFSHFPSE